MNPYDRAAFGFSQAYDMNMRAADEQRRVNRPSTEAFTQELEDERTDLNYSPNPETLLNRRSSTTTTHLNPLKTQ